MEKVTKEKNIQCLKCAQVIPESHLQDHRDQCVFKINLFNNTIESIQGQQSKHHYDYYKRLQMNKRCSFSYSFDCKQFPIASILKQYEDNELNIEVNSININKWSLENSRQYQEKSQDKEYNELQSYISSIEGIPGQYQMQEDSYRQYYYKNMEEQQIARNQFCLSCDYHNSLQQSQVHPQLFEYILQDKWDHCRGKPLNKSIQSQNIQSNLFVDQIDYSDNYDQNKNTEPQLNLDIDISSQFISSIIRFHHQNQDYSISYNSQQVYDANFLNSSYYMPYYISLQSQVYDSSFINNFYNTSQNLSFQLEEQNSSNNVGLQLHQIENLQRIEYICKQIIEQRELCTVCICDFESGQTLTKLNCKHLFHYQCISTWLQINRKCPLCKTSQT